MLQQFGILGFQQLREENQALIAQFKDGKGYL